MKHISDLRNRSRLISARYVAAGRAAALFAALLCGLAARFPATAVESRLLGIRVGYWEDRVRVVCDLDGKVSFSHESAAHPASIILDLANTNAVGVKAPALRDRLVPSIRLEPLVGGTTRIVIEVGAAPTYNIFTLGPGDGRPDRVVCDIFRPGKPSEKPAVEPERAAPAAPSVTAPAKPPAPTKPEAPPTKPEAAPTKPEQRAPQPPVPAPSAPPKQEAAQPSPQARATEEPNWVVVIDPGHGGVDPGAVHGRPRLREKEITLAVAKRIAEELGSIPGIAVRLTRQKDEFVGLRERLREADTEDADVFVSVHVNGCTAPSAKGAEVFFLSMSGASDAASKELEALENQPDMGADPVTGELAELPFAVDLIQTDTIERSSLLAEVMLNVLGNDQLAATRGVKQANFVVLRSIRVPSVLVEVGFLSNPEDAESLRSADHISAVGKSLASGLVDFRTRYARHTPAP